MIPVIVKLCESPSKAGGLLMINQKPMGLERVRHPEARPLPFNGKNDCAGL